PHPTLHSFPTRRSSDLSNSRCGSVMNWWCGRNGEGGIRTPDRGISPYNGLANRRLQPLGHLSRKPAALWRLNSSDSATSVEAGGDRKSTRLNSSHVSIS